MACSEHDSGLTEFFSGAYAPEHTTIPRHAFEVSPENDTMIGSDLRARPEVLCHLRLFSYARYAIPNP